MGLFDFFKKKSKNSENARRDFLMRNGRITEGTVIDIQTTEKGEVVFYVYNVQGVDYESSELLTSEQMKNPLRYAPGAKVSIRYDPRNHGNSILE